jgi:hypothetical protein
VTTSFGPCKGFHYRYNTTGHNYREHYYVLHKKGWMYHLSSLPKNTALADARVVFTLLLGISNLLTVNCC